MSETILEIDNLKKYFPVNKGILFRKTVGWLKAVDEINFCIRKSETFALVGESGCGKTTTARLILLLLHPTAGAIMFHGEDIGKFKGDKLKKYRCSVQSVFQDPFSSLNARMCAGNIIAEPLIVNKSVPSGQIRERVEELQLQVGLDPDSFNQYPHSFSGGQRQRIALARSIALNPSIVVLDEPVSALDVSIRAQIMNLLKDLQQQLGLSYLLIAHDLATIRYMSHRVGIMYLGKIVELAAAEELFINPMHPYTQALLASALPSHPDNPVEEIALPGEVPSPINIPAGCRFHPRCFKVHGKCSEDIPSLREIKKEHWLACHLGEEYA
jgi:oligopeptide/dipeptide ABC transporter ATP-binding protein